MTYYATSRFWSCYEKLPAAVRDLADTSFGLLKDNPRHPSLHLKKVNQLWSVRVGRKYRALAVEEGGDLIWFSSRNSHGIWSFGWVNGSHYSESLATEVE